MTSEVLEYTLVIETIPRAMLVKASVLQISENSDFWCSKL